MDHPLLVVPPGARLRVALALVLFAIALSVWLGSMDEVLRGPGTEGGIVGYEFCGEVARCQAQLDAMEARGASTTLAMSLGVDYAFLLAYSTAIAAVIVFLAARLPRAPRALAAIASAQWIAAGLDAIENYALWRMLAGGARDPWPAIAAWCAAPKFAIVAVGLLTVLVLLGMSVRSR
ncbi:hypothetical protein [Sandaracinus amylolyticus]|uniref:hypothetical protein n=1 Tax=Sandaracinus amylolyticus TaxID=927083 RepID=UPI001F303259|nr:hypothetical protein [Sandaracinus amylolyticus]